MILTVTYVLHYSRRRHLAIACQPGSLASAVSLLAQSRFPATAGIHAGDDEKAVTRKLGKMRFGFHRSKTWAIEAEELMGSGGLGEDYELGQHEGRMSTALLAEQAPLPYAPYHPASYGGEGGYGDSPGMATSGSYQGYAPASPGFVAPSHH